MQAPLNDWLNTMTKEDVIAVAGVLLAIIAILTTVWGWTLRSWITERRLVKEFGAELYLPEEIRNATRYYVRPHATSIDLAQEMEEGSNVVATREDLFKAVERFLNEESQHRHMLLLADSGMGKSSFVLNYYDYNRRRLFKSYKLAVIPLGFENALEKIKGIQKPKETIIFLDAFDEDPEARKGYEKRLDELMKACSEFRRVLITCRTQFFPKDAAIPTVARMVFTPRLGHAQHTFWRLYLAPFSEKQVNVYLRRRFWFWSIKKKAKARALANKVPKLTVRPMLLAHIPDIVRGNKPITTTWDIYERMTDGWYERELGFWKHKEDLIRFSEEVAVQFYLAFLENGSHRVSRETITNIIDDLSLSLVDLDEWKATARSLLHRDAKGDWKFAHRSIMEFLYLKRFFAGDWRCRGVPWTEYMKRFVLERNSMDGRLLILSLGSSVGADLSGSDLGGNDLSGIDLSEANLNETVLIQSNLNKAKLVGASLIKAKLNEANLSEADLTQANLSETTLTRADASEAKFVGVNLNKSNLSGARLVKTDLRRANLSDADLRGVDFSEANFIGTDLTRADLREASIGKTNFRLANLRGAFLPGAELIGENFRGGNCSGANFQAANLAGTDFSEANFSGANLSGAKLNKAIFRQANLSRADLSRADIDDAIFNHANLTEAKLEGASLNRTDFREAKLQRATLNRASQIGANFNGADLREANLCDAVLIDASFDGADLDKAKLERAVLSGTNLLKVKNLSETEFLNARSDQKTIVPPALEETFQRKIEEELKLTQQMISRGSALRASVQAEHENDRDVSTAVERSENNPSIE